MGALNFFRSLASALVVAVMGAILLAGLGATPGRGSASVVAISMNSAGVDVALVFRYVFLSALFFLALSLVFLMLMEERPLRSTTTETPAAPPAE
jgi:hypothetical protein